MFLDYLVNNTYAYFFIFKTRKNQSNTDKHEFYLMMP